MLGEFRYYVPDYFFIPIDLLKEFDKELSNINDGIWDGFENDLFGYINKFLDKYDKYIINKSICNKIYDIDFILEDNDL